MVVAALREGNFEHEAREALEEKNLLAVGDVDANEVARRAMFISVHRAGN